MDVPDDATLLAHWRGGDDRAGRALVERQYKMFDDVLAKLDKGVIAPKYVDRDEIR